MKRKRIAIVGTVLVFVASLGGYSWQALTQPVAALQVSPVNQLKPTPAGSIDLPWPAYGGSALSINGGTVNLTHGSAKQSPTASTAKVMTALAVLDKKPITTGAPGPNYTITTDDVTSYVNYVAKDGSVVPVQIGEVLTERQMLQALMLPSANNIADTLAIWAFGSLPNYVQYANQKAAELGMKDSYFADASGFSPATVSTPSDLVKLGNEAVKHDTLMEIAGQKTADIPVAGTIRNVNSLLGQDGVIGLKTGNTDEAGGCFLMAGRIVPNGGTEPVTVVTAIMAAPTRATAVRDSLPFMKAVAANFETITVAKAGTALYRYDAQWGGQTQAVLKQDITLLRWKGGAINTSQAIAKPKKFYNASEMLGTVKASGAFGSATSEVVATDSVQPPSNWWLLTHAF